MEFQIESPNIKMETRTFTDPGGDSETYKFYDGVNFPGLLPGDAKEHVQSITNLNYKEGEVLLASYAKAGTHWTTEIMQMLLNGSSQYCQNQIRMFDFKTPEELEKLEENKLLITHFYPKHIPRAFLEAKGKIVYVYRNPKDTAVSYQTFMKRLEVGGRAYDGKWENFIEMYMQGHVAYNSWAEHVGAWMDFKKTNPDYPILIISFEDMKKDLRGNVQKIAEHLGTKQDLALLDEIASKCQFKAMHKEKTDNISEDDKKMSRDGGNPFYRKGDVGDWKNWFTVAQNERFDVIMKDELVKIDLPIVYTLD